MVVRPWCDLECRRFAGRPSGSLEVVVLADGIAGVESDGGFVSDFGPGDYFGEIAVVVLVRARNFRPSLRVREPCRSG
jgi:hypothetical protein